MRVWETTTQHGLAVDIQADAPVTGGRQDESARGRIDTELWNDSADDRRRTARSRDRDTMTAELVSEAESLRDLGLDVRSAVVYVPRPAPGGRRDR